MVAVIVNAVQKVHPARRAIEQSVVQWSSDSPGSDFDGPEFDAKSVISPASQKSAARL
ncbi:MAG: hypothetical protein JWN34_1960 [Bryobacterales bacterium]|nr:hypothetical protein [Bryobacterales bacterium]